MGKISNLTEQNVIDLQKKFGEMKQDNPDLKWAFNDQEESIQPDELLLQKICILEKKIDALTGKFDLIFGDTILINGKFVDIKELDI